MTLEDVIKGLDAVADDYLTKPFRAQELLSRVRTMLHLKETQDSLRRANHRIDELASGDELTGLLNLRTICRRADEEISRAKRMKKSSSGLMINVDGFSRINRENGFLFGSQVLREVAAEIKKCLRSIDHLARIGGDEFFAFLVETDLAGAEFMAERVRDAIHSKTFKNDRHSVKLSVSIGIAAITADQNEAGAEDLLHMAAEAYHSAKSNGPNQIEVYSRV